MARWRLREKHYINCPGCEWQYTEISQQTGKPARRTFNVPRFLNPDDPADWTRHRPNAPGEVIVCHEGKGDTDDITFLGDPTPDMEPLDEEARKISERLAHRWVHPIESLPGSYSESIINNLQQQIDDISRSPENKSLSGVSQDAFEALQKQVQELMEQNAKMANLLAEKPKAQARRI